MHAPITGLIPAGQLELPLGAEVERAWTVSAAGRSLLTLEVELLRGGARARLLGRWRDCDDQISEREVQWTFDMSVAPPLHARRSLDVSASLLVTPIAARSPALDPVLAAGQDTASSILALDRPLDRRARDDVERSLLAIQRHLASRVVRPASDVAARFSPSARWAVYAVCASDRTGRVAQLAITCPGLLVFLAALASHGDRSTGPELCRLAASGARSTLLLDRAVAAWASCALVPPSSEAFRAARLRIARAGLRVPPAVLWGCAGLPLVPEDIPSETYRNLVWYRWQAALARTLRHRLVTEAAGCLAPFLSRHALALQGLMHPESDDDVVGVIHGLSDFVRVTGRRPSRATSPSRLLEECETWHVRRQWDCDYDPEHPIPAGALEGLERWTRGRDRIERLRTVGDLLAESSRMHHCVASYADQAVAGLLHVAHGRIEGAEVTIAITWSRDDDRPQLSEAAGIANRRPGELERDVIFCWLADLAAARRARPGEEPRLRGRFS